MPVGGLVPQGILGDQDLLDVGRAFTVHEKVGVSAQPRNTVLRGQAVAAEDLLRLARAELRG